MTGTEFPLSILIGAALADSINPCVIGVTIFLLAFLNSVYKNRNKMLVGGMMYVVSVYLTYLALGFGFLEVALFSAGFSTYVYWIAAIVAIIAGLLEIKDYFWYGRGLTLQLIPGAGERIKAYTEKLREVYRVHPKKMLILIAILGVFVVLVELPCTGAPYFAVLALLAQGVYAKAVPYLLIYNLVFIFPLLVIIAISYFSRNGERVEEWRLRNRRFMRLFMGILLIGIGIYMIYSAIGPVQ
ncbi:cytochrome c biogenesis protein CcdA [Patescibacteria group bacterium]